MHAPLLTHLSLKVIIKVLNWSEDTASTREPPMTALARYVLLELAQLARAKCCAILSQDALAP